MPPNPLQATLSRVGRESSPQNETATLGQTLCRALCIDTIDMASFNTQPQEGAIYCFCFIREGTEAQRLSDLSEVIQLVIADMYSAPLALAPDFLMAATEHSKQILR